MSFLDSQYYKAYLRVRIGQPGKKLVPIHVADLYELHTGDRFICVLQKEGKPTEWWLWAIDGKRMTKPTQPTAVLCIDSSRSKDIGTNMLWDVPLAIQSPRFQQCFRYVPGQDPEAQQSRLRFEILEL